VFKKPDGKFNKLSIEVNSVGPLLIFNMDFIAAERQEVNLG
jgi:hypothetical protein